MALRSHNLGCLVCEARSGQLFPFCEWCGAKHSYTAEGEFILTGQICQVCGVQAEMPFARCPACKAARHVLCPACGASVAIRARCGRCGLHYAFFDKVRREQRTKRRRGNGLALRTAALVLAFSMGAAAIELRDAPAPPLFSSIVAIGIALSLGFLMFSRRPRRSPRSLPSNDMVSVLDSYDPDECAAARSRLADGGIDATVIAVHHVGRAVPPGDLRRVLVARSQAALGRWMLSEQGFNVAESSPVSTTRRRPGVLRLIRGGRTGGQG